MFKSNLKRLAVLLSLAIPLFACRMLGVIALPGESLSSTYVNGEWHPYLMEELEEFRLQGGSGGWPYSNSDGWAMTAYHISGESLETLTARSALEAFSDNGYYYEASNLLAPVEVPLLLGHLRQTSSGADGIDNPHPFLYTTTSGTTYSFAHNGDLNKADLRELIGDEWLSLHPPQTYGSGPWNGSGWDDVVDSELFFFWLVMNIESSETMVAGIMQALNVLEEQQPYNIKNFLFSDGSDLIAYRRSLASDIYYFDALNDPDIPPHLSGSNHRAIMSTPPPNGLVSELPWVELEDRSLLVFREDGSTEIHAGFLGTESFNHDHKPEQIALTKAYPNPFNNRIVIPIGVEESGYYTLNIFDTRGRLVYSDSKSLGNAGDYLFEWSGQDIQGIDLDSGTYVYQISTGSDDITAGKMLLLK